MTYLCLALLLVLAGIFYEKKAVRLLKGDYNKMTVYSDDPLSVGMVERWNAALPAGFSKESAEHIADGRGYSFAKLTYEKDVADILAKWETPAADMQARFDAVIDAQLADASTTQADAALIEAARPTLDESWVCFSLQSEDDPNDVILLAYQSATHVMIVAEQQK